MRPGRCEGAGKIQALAFWPDSVEYGLSEVGDGDEVVGVLCINRTIQPCQKRVALGDSEVTNVEGVGE